MTTISIQKGIVFTLSLVFLHFLLLAFCVKTNTFQGIGLDEARYLSAGVYHWRHGDFAPANDSPPLTRMLAALPLLPLEVRLERYDRTGRGVDMAADARDRELRHGGRFASSDLNFHKYKLFCLARMTGFLWWLLGAWVIGRWAGELYGPCAGWLALALWCIGPHVLAFEQRVTPDLPLAVIWAVATSAYRGYLRSPSWERALVSGLLLGVAQLVDFVSLALLLIWPVLALVQHLAPAGRDPAGVAQRTRMLRRIAATGLCLWVINLGYGFSDSGTPLGRFDFARRALTGDSPDRAGRAPGRDGGNRFRGTWLGRVACPVPPDYILGLGRRLDEWRTPPEPPGGEGWPAEAADDPLVTAGERRPVGLWGMMLGAAILMLAGRRPGGPPPAEELTVWVPVAAILLMAAPAVGLVPGTAGILLMTPFGIIIASSLAGPRGSGPRGIRWAAALLSAWAIAGGLSAIAVDEITPANRARLRLDLDKYLRRLGLAAPQGDIPRLGGEHGLLYRTFVDSRGVPMHYALFVPRGYRGDRPYPLIFFLHGHGDRGTEGRQYTAVGLPFTLRYREIDFLVLCPQGPSGGWDPGGEDARRAMELLAAVERSHRVDTKRVYLTGLSSGGTGAWALAAAHPGRWAAIVPVAGAPPGPAQAPLIKDIPCWCFHNRYDGDSPVADVRRMIGALRTAGGRPRYTEYLNVNHDAWDQAYQSPELFDWLKRQRLP